MSMSFGLAATLNTSQKLTPQMQQAIKLLQLSNLELAQEVQAKLDSNPLLERVEEEDDLYDSNEGSSHADTPESPLNLDMWNSETAANSSQKDRSSDDYDDEPSDSFDKLQQSGIDDSAMDSSDINNDYQNMDTGNYASTAAVGGSTNFDDLDSYQGSTSASIQDYVRWQLNFKHLSDTDMLIADYLMDAMDS